MLHTVDLSQRPRKVLAFASQDWSLLWIFFLWSYPSATFVSALLSHLWTTWMSTCFHSWTQEKLERLEIEQKVLNSYHYGSQILCGQFIESNLANWPIKYTKKDQDEALKPLYSGLHANKKVDCKLQPNVWWLAYADAYQGNAHGPWNFMSNSTLLLSYRWQNYKDKMYL